MIVEQDPVIVEQDHVIVEQDHVIVEQDHVIEKDHEKHCYIISCELEHCHVILDITCHDHNHMTLYFTNLLCFLLKQ